MDIGYTESRIALQSRSVWQFLLPSIGPPRRVERARARRRRIEKGECEVLEEMGPGKNAAEVICRWPQYGEDALQPADLPSDNLGALTLRRRPFTITMAKKLVT